jgi:hypothetical protein
MAEESTQATRKWTDNQEIYLDWLASPKSLREPKSQTELADKIGVSRKTLYNWQEIDGFKEERLRRLFNYFIPDTPDIVVALRDKCLTGDTPAINTWLERIEQIASQLNIKGEFNLKEFYESILNRRPEIAGGAELPSPPKTTGGSGKPGEVQDTGGGKKVREVAAGSVSGDKNPAGTGDKKLDSSANQ